jgi:hypothetical protein
MHRRRLKMQLQGYNGSSLNQRVLLGKYLLEHMFMKHQLCYKTKVKDLYAPNVYLDVAMLPGKMEILWFKTASDLTKRSIMGDCDGNGDTMNLVARKLNQTGYIQRHCGLVNTEEKVRKLQNQLQLSDSIASMTIKLLKRELRCSLRTIKWRR